MKVGDTVELSEPYFYKGTVGTILYLEPGLKGTIVNIRIENSRNYKVGQTTRVYERFVKIIRSKVDSTSIYQPCIECRTLTSVKVKSYHVCCQCKSINGKIYA